MTNTLAYSPSDNYGTQSRSNTANIIRYGLAISIALGTGIYFLNRAIKKNKEKKSDTKSFEDGSPQTIAKQIRMALENSGVPGVDLVKLRYLMSSLKSKEQWNQIVQQYDNQFQINLPKDMYRRLDASEYDEMMFIKESKPDKVGQKIAKDVLYKNWAKRLKSAFDKKYTVLPGTDEKAIKVVFTEIPTQNDFVQVGKAYQKEYKTNFIKDLKSELESWEYPDYMKLIVAKPKG